MRISQDVDSWHAGGVLRRDFRADRGDPETPHRGRRKNTRRWCRGVTGREHVAGRFAVPHPDPAVTSVRYEIRCIHCGRTRLPAAVRAAVDPTLARQLALAARWCTAGHLYETTTELHYGYRWPQRTCVMCGHTG